MGSVIQVLSFLVPTSDSFSQEFIQVCKHYYCILLGHLHLLTSWFVLYIGDLLMLLITA